MVHFPRGGLLKNLFNGRFDFSTPTIWYPHLLYLTTIAILTLTSPMDINVPTRSTLALVTEDSFVSLFAHLNNKKLFLNSDVSYS